MIINNIKRFSSPYIHLTRLQEKVQYNNIFSVVKTHEKMLSFFHFPWPWKNVFVFWIILKRKFFLCQLYFHFQLGDRLCCEGMLDCVNIFVDFLGLGEIMLGRKGFFWREHFCGISFHYTNLCKFIEFKLNYTENFFCLDLLLSTALTPLMITCYYCVNVFFLDIRYIKVKLVMTLNEWKKYQFSPPKKHMDYNNRLKKKTFQMIIWLKKTH